MLTFLTLQDFWLFKPTKLKCLLSLAMCEINSYSINQNIWASVQLQTPVQMHAYRRTLTSPRKRMQSTQMCTHHAYMKKENHTHTHTLTRTSSMCFLFHVGRRPNFVVCLPESARDSCAVLTASGLTEVSRVATMPNGHIKRRH